MDLKKQKEVTRTLLRGKIPSQGNQEEHLLASFAGSRVTTPLIPSHDH